MNEFIENFSLKKYLPMQGSGYLSFSKKERSKFRFFESPIIVLIVVSTSITLFTGCGITQPIRPIEEGTTEIVTSFGGPIIPVGSIAFPVPYLNVGALYGYNKNLTVFGNYHVTALLFKDIGFDAGFSTRLLPEKGIRPEITFNGRGYFFWDAFRGKTTRLYPMGTLTASYRVDEQSLFYFGTDNLYQMTTSDLFVSSFIGYSFPVGETIVMQFESKWIGMNRDTQHGIFEGVTSVAGNGNVGLFFGLQYSLK